MAQAVAFSIFGLNQFSMAVAPTFALCLILFINYWFARRLRLAPLLALFFSIGFLCIPQALWVSLAVRYDIYVTLFSGLAIVLAFLCFYEDRPKLLIGTGFCLASAVISYYQFAPVAASLGLVSVVGQRPSLPPRTSIFFLLLGALAPTLCFVFWILPDTALFFHQNLAYATGYQFGQRWYNFISLGRVQMQALGCGLLLVISLVSERSTSVTAPLIGLRIWLVGLAFSALVSAIMAVYAFDGMLIQTAMLASLCLLLTQLDCKRAGISLQNVILAFMAAVTLVSIIFTTLVGISSSGRRFSVFGKQVAAQSNLDGIVLIDNPAWLAFRERVPRDRLIHLPPPAIDASQLNRSIILDDPHSATSVSTIVVRDPQLPILRTEFSLVAEFLRRSDVEGPITVGDKLPYRVVIYRVKN
jgi:hypothetical protein